MLLLLSVALAADLVDDMQPAWSPGTFTPQAGAHTTALYPLGFSASGAFAWYEELPGNDVGGYLWQVVVVDLVHDRELGRLTWTPAELTTVVDLPTWRAAHAADARALLARLGVTASPGPLRPLPVERDGGAIAIGVRLNSPGELATLTATRLDGKAKELARVPVDTGELPPQPYGWFASPLEPRAAVLSVQARQGFEGAPAVLTPLVTGMQLEAGFR